MPAEEDLYEILQVRPSAYPDVIEGAYKALSLLYHPDRNAAPEAAESLNKVNHAFAVLSDPIKRKQYDRRRSRRGLMKLLFGGGDGRSQVLRVSLRVAPIGLAAVVYIVFVRGQLGGGAANLGAPALDVLKDYSQSLAEFMPPTTQAGQGVVPASGAVDGQQSGDGAGADPEIDSAAIAELDEAVSRDPGDAAAYLNRGVAYSSLGGHQRAIEDFAEAIRLKPEYTEAYYERGIAYARLGRLQETVEDDSQAILINPAYGVAYANRALAYTQLGRDDEAQGDVQRAIELGIDADLLNDGVQAVKAQR